MNIEKIIDNKDINGNLCLFLDIEDIINFSITCKDFNKIFNISKFIKNIIKTYNDYYFSYIHNTNFKCNIMPCMTSIFDNSRNIYVACKIIRKDKVCNITNLKEFNNFYNIFGHYGNYGNYFKLNYEKSTLFIKGINHPLFPHLHGTYMLTVNHN